MASGARVCAFYGLLYMLAASDVPVLLWGKRKAAHGHTPTILQRATTGRLVHIIPQILPIILFQYSHFLCRLFSFFHLLLSWILPIILIPQTFKATCKRSEQEHNIMWNGEVERVQKSRIVGFSLTPLSTVMFCTCKRSSRAKVRMMT